MEVMSPPMSDLQEIQALDPKRLYRMDPVTGVIYAKVPGGETSEPFAQTDRFGIPLKAALKMFRHNMELQ